MSASIQSVFHTTVNDLQTQANTQAEAAHGQAERPWQVPAAVADVLDVPGITAGFDRDAANQAYAQVISAQNKGTLGDTISLKTQIDYTAIAERGFRARHASAVRCMALAVARRTGHGQAAGVFTGGVETYAQDALQAGSA